MAYTTFSQTKNDQLKEPMFFWSAGQRGSLRISKNMTSSKS